MHLVRSGMLSPDHAEWAHTRSVREDRPLAQVLVDAGLIDPADLQPVMHQLQGTAAQENAGSAPTAESLRASQERCARMLRTLFELCIENQLIDAEDFMRRVARLAEQDGDAS
jgi:hypothetical protein